MTPECAIEILQVRKIRHCNPDEAEAWQTLTSAVLAAQTNNNARDEILLCYPNTSCECNDRGRCRSANQCDRQRKTSPVA